MHFVSWYRHRAYVENYPLVFKEIDVHGRERERALLRSFLLLTEHGHEKIEKNKIEDEDID